MLGYLVLDVVPLCSRCFDALFERSKLLLERTVEVCFRFGEDIRAAQIVGVRLCRKFHLEVGERVLWARALFEARFVEFETLFNLFRDPNEYGDKLVPKLGSDDLQLLLGEFERAAVSSIGKC